MGGTQEQQQLELPSPQKFGGEVIFRPDCYPTYKRRLDRFMEYKNKKEAHFYEEEYEYSIDELLAIRPTTILRFLCLMAFGKEKPGKDDLPLFARADTLKGYKTALSHFMPNTQQWDEQHQIGNPTKSRDINKMIKHVSTLQTQGRGKESKADSPWEPREFALVVDMLGRMTNRDKSLIYPSMTLTQMSMIARIDDTVKWRVENFRIHPDVPHAYELRLPWSKNVKDERDAPWQIQFAANNWRLDPLLRLALYLEYKYESGEGRRAQFIYSVENETPKRVKGRYSKDIREGVVRTDEFQDLTKSLGMVPTEKPKRKGAHSTRKYAKTRSRRKGKCSKDDSNYRGRWKGDAAKASSRYEDTYLPYPDAKVCAELCHDGPIAYLITGSAWVTDNWIVQHVSPNITAVHGTLLGALLGRAILWACFDPDARVIVDHHLYNKIMSAYRGGHPSSSGDQNQQQDNNSNNPIQKLFLMIYAKEEEAVVEVIDNGLDGSGAFIGRMSVEDAEMGCVPHGTIEQRLFVLEHRVTSVQDEAVAIRNDMKLNQEKNDKSAAITHTMLRRINQTPFITQRKRKRDTSDDGTDGEAVGDTNNDVEVQHYQSSMDATLSKTPKDLYMLWEEYDQGIGGRKAARKFTAEERGRCKYTYCRRNVVWQLINRVINHSGCDYKVAIEMIYDVYGYMSVTKLLKKILEDEKAGGHANLYPDQERANKRRKGRNS